MLLNKIHMRKITLILPMIEVGQNSVKRNISPNHIIE